MQNKEAYQFDFYIGAAEKDCLSSLTLIFSEENFGSVTFYINFFIDLPGEQ